MQSEAGRGGLAAGRSAAGQRSNSEARQNCRASSFRSLTPNPLPAPFGGGEAGVAAEEEVQFLGVGEVAEIGDLRDGEGGVAQ